MSDTPLIDPAVLLYLERFGYVVVPRFCVSGQGMRSALRPSAADVADLPVKRESIPPHPSVPRRLLRATAQVFEVSVAELLGHRRSQRIAWPRQCGMFFAAHYLGYTLPQVGRVFGDRDHSTALHAVRKVRAKLELPESRAAVAESLDAIWAEMVPPALVESRCMPRVA